MLASLVAGMAVAKTATKGLDTTPKPLPQNKPNKKLETTNNQLVYHE
jgi:hypothetical protein